MSLEFSGDDDDGPGNLKRPDVHAARICLFTPAKTGDAGTALGDFPSARKRPADLRVLRWPGCRLTGRVYKSDACPGPRDRRSLRGFPSGRGLRRLPIGLADRCGGDFAVVGDREQASRSCSGCSSSCRRSIGRALRHSFSIPAGALPVLLLLLAIVGVAWSERDAGRSIRQHQDFCAPADHRRAVRAVPALRTRAPGGRRRSWRPARCCSSCRGSIWLVPSLASRKIPGRAGQGLHHSERRVPDLRFRARPSVA